MSFVIDHVREIDAPAAVGWRVLTDFDRYAEWNPFAVAARCDLRPGGKLAMQVALFPGRVTSQTEYVTAVEPGHGFTYSMKPAPAGLLRSARSQRIDDIGAGRCRYTSRFLLDGPLAPVAGFTLGRLLRRGFGGNVDGLVSRAEHLAR